MGEYAGEGATFDARGLRVATVVARFNESVTRLLADRAAATLAEHGIPEADAPVYWVPGAFELPVVAKRLAESGEYVAGECAAGLSRVALDTGVPVVFGVLTTNDLDQALDRCGGAHGDKGAEAATTALEIAALLRNLPSPKARPC